VCPERIWQSKVFGRLRASQVLFWRSILLVLATSFRRSPHGHRLGKLHATISSSSVVRRNPGMAGKVK
jgi:hypothetical protein